MKSLGKCTKHLFGILFKKRKRRSIKAYDETVSPLPCWSFCSIHNLVPRGSLSGANLLWLIDFLHSHYPVSWPLSIYLA